LSELPASPTAWEFLDCGSELSRDGARPAKSRSSQAHAPGLAHAMANLAEIAGKMVT